MAGTRLAELLEQYRSAEPRRARGGIWAISGFSLQIRSYLADVCEALASGELATQRDLLPEGLSDLAELNADNLVCVQVKRTLTRASLRSAALEFIRIDEFLEEYAPDLFGKVRYEVRSCRTQLEDERDPWSSLVVPSGLDRREARVARYDRLRSEGRLLEPRTEPDPE